MELIEKALRLAVTAHKEQLRKTDGSPYVVHPIMVARLLERYGWGEVVVAAALTHDVLEDTPLTAAELKDVLGEEVLAIVEGVSEDKSLPPQQRKELYIESILAGSEAVKAVSVADKIHNAQSLIDFYAIYGESTWENFSTSRTDKLEFERTLLTRLQAVWDHPLLEEYEELVNKLENL